MKIIRTNADIAATDEVMASTLRLISEQPTDWFIRVGFYKHPGHVEAEVEGTISLFDQDILVIADMDREAQHTGASTAINLHDITEIEVL
jgi:hypothetical protein